MLPAKMTQQRSSGALFFFLAVLSR